MESEIRQRRKLKWIIFVLVFLIILMLATAYFLVIRVTPRFEEQTFELGNVTLSEDIKDYLKSSNYMLKKGSLDTSKVVRDEVGDYNVTCDLGKKHYVFDIHIVDTTAPSVDFIDSYVYATYNECFIDDIVSANDLSEIDEFEIVSCKPSGGDTTGNTKVDIKDNAFTVEEPGQYTIMVHAQDIYGNATDNDVTVEFLEAPHFVLLSDREYKLNSSSGLLDVVFAEDRDGNNITDAIEVTDDGGFDITQVGDYEVTYEVADQDDIKREKTVIISVDSFKETDYGFDKEKIVEAAVKYDYFSYEPLSENTDHDAIVELTSPASFSIKYNFSNQCAFGSAYLYEVTEDYLYFFTNKHCATITSKSEFEVIDYEGDEVWLSNSNTECFKSEIRDLMCFKVPVEKVPTDVLIKYRKVLIDWDIYDKVEENAQMLSNVQEHGSPWSRNYKDYCTDVTLASSCVEEKFDYKFDYPYLTTNETFVKPGMSGSPLFTYDGYLMGTATMIFSSRQGRMDGYERIDGLQALLESVEIE